MRNQQLVDVNALPPVLTVMEMARVLRIGRSSAYELVRTGVVPCVRVGKLVRIPRDAFLTWLESEKPPISGSAA